MDDKIEIYEGTPKKQDSKQELTRWQRFLVWFMPELEDKYGLANRAAQAKVDQLDANAEKTGAETAKIVAEKDQQKSATTQADFALIDDIFKPGQDQAAQMLKLARLLEDRPELEQQLKKVRSMLIDLSRRHGTVVETGNPPTAVIPEPAEESTDSK